MPTTTTRYWLAAITMAAYGILALVGGIIGFVAKESKASLVAGSVSCLLLWLFTYHVQRRPAISLIGAAVVGMSLVARFTLVLWTNLDRLGTYVGETAGIISVLMILGGLLVVFVSVLSLAGSRTVSP